MLIEIDLDEAKKLHITMNQFCLLRFLVDNVNIKPYQSVIQIDDNDIQNLKLQKIVTSESEFDINDLSKIKLTEEFNKKLKPLDFFDEFNELFPPSVIRPEGNRDYLKGDINRCRKSYDSKVGKSRSKHESIMEALRFELQNRRLTNTMKYMKRMYKWLTSEEWLLYDEFMKGEKVKEQIEHIYGTNVE